MENKPVDSNELETLEDPDTGPVASAQPETVPTETKKTESKLSSTKRLLKGSGRHFNIYLLFFIFILLLVVVFTFASIKKNSSDLAGNRFDIQKLSDDDLKKINNGDTSVGDPKQTLNVESNAVFTGKVLIRDSLDVAGTIKVGGALNLPGLTVAGTSTFDQIQTNTITASGDANIQGQVSIQRGLTVTGSASFGGNISAPQITVQSINLSGDLQIQRHIDAGGATPSKSDGNKLGNGGTTSVSGTDTAGTVNINLGANPSANDGCFITVNFVQKFNSTPHVVITPVGSNAAGLNYYINRNANNFQICATNTSSGNFSFDYIVID